MKIKLKKSDNLVPLSNYAREKRFSIMQSYLHKSDRILDLGCGDMWLCDLLFKLGYKNVKGIDIKYPVGKHFHDECCDNFLLENASKTHFKNNYFDVIVAIQSLEHINCMDEIKRILKPNGILIVSLPNTRYEWIFSILGYLHLTIKRGTPHINKITLETIPMKLIFKKAMFFGLTNIGIFRKKEKD